MSWSAYGWWNQSQVTTDNGGGFGGPGLEITGAIEPYTDGNPDWAPGSGEMTGAIQGGDGDNGTTDEQLTGGQYEWCMDAAGTADTITAVLDTPSTNLNQSWPPEIDWYEDMYGSPPDNNSEWTMTVHWENSACDAGGIAGNCQFQRVVMGQENDTWNEYDAVWSIDTGDPADSYVRMFENGTKVATITNANCAAVGPSHTDCIPTSPLSFDIQTQEIDDPPPTAGTTYVNWAAGYCYSAC